MKVVSIGEILWDVFPDGERLGGAPFNLAVQLHRLGHEVLFVSAVGDDERGRIALHKMQELGLSTQFVRRVSGVATGTVTVSIRDGEPDYVIHRPAAYDFLEIPEIDADWVCYGSLAWFRQNQDRPARMPARRQECPPHFFDVNLRKDSYNRALIEELMLAADVVKLNESELAYMGRSLKQLRDEYKLRACCVTLGDRGCRLFAGDDYAEVAAYPVEVADSVGAGDAFAAGFLHGLDQGWPAARIGDFANFLGSRAASRAGAI